MDSQLQEWWGIEHKACTLQSALSENTDVSINTLDILNKISRTSRGSQAMERNRASTFPEALIGAGKLLISVELWCLPAALGVWAALEPSP